MATNKRRPEATQQFLEPRDEKLTALNQNAAQRAPKSPVAGNPTVVALLDSVPAEVRSAIKMLSDDTRFAIVLTLVSGGEKSFSEIADLMGLEKNLLSHHLKVLCQAALVKNFYSKKEDTVDYSFYEASNIAKDFVHRLGLAGKTESS